jgi:hypothetical protein
MSGPGPQIEIPYVLEGPDGTRAVFNDQTDPDYVGALTAVSGFDSPEVRESFDDLVEFDGGVHGPFFYGRRPMTLEGLIYDHGSTEVRNERISRIKRACNAMRQNATLTFTPHGAEPMFAWVRRQQPLRVDGGWNKTFQIPLVAADPRFYSTLLSTSSVMADEQLGGAVGAGFDQGFDIDFGEAAPTGQLYVNVGGDTETYPIYTIFGPGTGPSIVNFTTGSEISLAYTLSATEGFIIDTLNRTVMLGTILDADNLDPSTLINRYSAIDFENTVWGGLAPGSNDLRFNWFSLAAGAKLKVDWRSAWL